jgi:hypothetical protein
MPECSLLNYVDKLVCLYCVTTIDLPLARLFRVSSCIFLAVPISAHPTHVRIISLELIYFIPHRMSETPWLTFWRAIRPELVPVP